MKVSHDGKNAFSLDGAKTKFASLEQLVDFYRMNAGPLPTLLRDTASVDRYPDLDHCSPLSSRRVSP